MARGRCGVDGCVKRIGILGGSFNPAHGGHRAISVAALDALGLDEVWWLVSPGNPLKEGSGDMAPFAARFASAVRVARHARIRVSAIEHKLGTRYTVDTVKKLRRAYPKIRFVWLLQTLSNAAETVPRPISRPHQMPGAPQ